MLLNAHTLASAPDSAEPMIYSLSRTSRNAAPFESIDEDFCIIEKVEGRAEGYPGEIRQVLSTLLLHAIEALHVGGTIAIHVFRDLDRRLDLQPATLYMAISACTAVDFLRDSRDHLRLLNVFGMRWRVQEVWHRDHASVRKVKRHLQPSQALWLPL